MMAEQKNCRNLERRPDKWKKKKVTWTIFVEYGECGKGVTLSIPKIVSKAQMYMYVMGHHHEADEPA